MKNPKAAWFAVAGITISIALAAFAQDYIGGYFQATGPIPSTGFETQTEVGQYVIDMTTSADTIALGWGNDAIQLGKGSDMIRFAGGSANQDPDIDKITFSADDETKIQHTRATDELLIKSSTGDVVIQIGN